MAKQLNVNLAFTADTGQAKAQLQSLQNQLTQVINMPTAGLGDKMAMELNQATRAAAELKIHLQNATNVKTGSLDFTKLNQSIKNSGSSLSEYAAKLQSIGPAGQKAFMLLAQSVASAEVPIRRSNALLSELWVTMKNTARWQLTSSMLHGFMGAVQSALRYTQDLNESLNNIRIVTGKSIDEMADFAKEANKAAKALSTTTTKYTDASLIFYQQGLNTEEVKKRTDVVIKMANAAGQSVETVSDQLTAVWNNFYDGTKSLEYYADVMTALGAATASSTDEIAGGLEKFAAIGETIGLSYEYAASALATITANTRQSEDVVGTALKTIFARIQGLNLGETLDDGTTLNKYSEALAKVGISIFDQAGELKDMDNILDEMGAKWETLNKAQQTALAQTVAGVRQYTQLVALMDNWNKGDNDSMKSNLATAYGSTGTLQDQADIYAESWQAARDEVKAAVEGLYDSLLNDEAFIDILKVVEHIVSGIERMIDSIGGFGGTITALGAIVMTVFRKQIAESITQASYSLMSWTEAGRQKIQQEKLTQYSEMLQNAKIGETEREVLEAQFKSYQQLTEKAKDLTDLERQTYQLLLDQQKARGALAIQKSEEAAKARAEMNEASIDAKWAIKGITSKKGRVGIRVNEQGDIVDKSQTRSVTYDEAFSIYDESVNKMIDTRSRYLNAKGSGAANVKELEQEYYKAADAVKQLEKDLKGAKDGLVAYKEKVEECTAKEKQATAAKEEAVKSIDMDTHKKKENADATTKQGAAIDKASQDTKENTAATEENTAATEKNTQAKKKLSSSDIAKNFTNGASAAMSMVSALQSMSSAIDVIQSDAKPFDKITSGLMSVLMAGSMTAMALKNLNKITNVSGETLGAVLVKSGKFDKMLGKLGPKIGATGGQYLALGSTILFVVAAIGALVGAAKLCVDAYNKEEKAAKKAAETSAQAAEAFKDATAAYEDFKSAQGGYEDAINGLRKLTQGTIEYKEQLMKANEQAMKMIESQNLLYGSDYEYDENGLIRFKEKYDENGKYLGRADEVARRNSFDDMQTAQASKLLADQQAQSAKTQADLVKFNRETLKTGKDNVSFAAEVAAFTTAGAILGSVVPGIGNAVGAGVGLGVGALVGAAAGIYEAVNTLGASTDQEEKAMLLLAEKYGEIGDAVLTEEQIKQTLAGQVDEATINTLIKASQENRDALQKQLAALEENTAALKMTLEATTQNANKGNEKYENLTSKEQQLANKIVANRAAGQLADKDSAEYKAAEEAALEKWRSETGHTGGMFAGNEDDAYDKYMEITYGQNWRDNYQVTNKGGTNATIEKKNTDGGWQNISSEKNTLSNEDVKNAIVTHYMQQYGTEADEIIMESLREVGKTLEQTIDGIDKDAVFDIQSAIASGSMVDLTLMSPEQIQQLQNNINSFNEEMRAAIQAGIDNYSEYAHEMRIKTEADSILSGGAQELEMSKASLEAYSKELMENNEALYSNAKLAAEAAVEHFRFSKALDNLEGIVKDNIAIIKKADKGSLDYYDSLGQVQEALIETFGMEVGSEFVEKNIDKIKSAAEGSAEAIEELGILISKEYVSNLEIASDNISAFFSKDRLGVDEAVVIGDNVFYNLDEFETYFNTIKNNVLGYIDEIAASGLSIGDSLNGTIDVESFINDLNQMAIATNMSVEDMNAMLSKMGVQAKVENTWVPGPVQVPRYRITEKQVEGDAFGNRVYETYTEELEPETIQDSGRMVASISYDGSDPSTDVKFVGAPKALTTSKNNNKSGGSTKKSAPTQKSSIIERYKEENDQLDDLSRAYSKANKEADRLYGASRLKKMQENNKLLKDEYDLLMKKIQRGKTEYLPEDKANLEAAVKKAGITFAVEYDADNNITNYEELMAPLFNDLKAAEAAGGETPSDLEQQRIDAAKERIDLVKEAISQFDSTREEIEDMEDEAEDKLDEWYQNNFDQLNYKLELQIELDESELKKLDYYLDKYSDDFSKMADSLELMIEKLNVHKGQLATYKTQWDDLKAAYAARNITQSQYIEGLKEVEDGMYSDLEAMNQLEKEIGNFYEETLSEATSELEDHTDHLEHLTSVFDHYLTLMELTGRSKNYEAMGDFLGGKAQTIKDRLDVENKYYETLLAQQKEVRDEYEKALKSGDEAKIKAWKKNLDAITDEVDAAHEKVLSSTEEWVEAMKAVYENDLAAAADKLEKALTGGVGFEVLMDGFDKLNARQEEFLTKTNQIYETDKLMRTAHQALDKTDNAVSKQKLKNFIDETKALQENSQLSKYELEIQQAKYDLLVAEMALEEAKNAKSTVRLQRDSEGNFGYVYTADQDAVNDAEQNYYDAQNRLYNISLEGQQKYTEKFLQAQQDMYNELAELDRLRADGTIATDEELAMRREQVLAHYMDPVNGILTQYSKLYNIAVQTDSKATADYWAADYGAMTQNSEAWKIAVNGYFTEVDTATNTWKTVSETANKIVKKALDNSATATKNLKDESEDLRDEINDEVIPALETELKKVDELTTGFLNQQKQIEKTRLEYEDYLRTLGTEIETNSNQVLEDKLPDTSTNGGTGDTGGSGGNPTKNPTKGPAKNPVGSEKYGWAAVNAARKQYVYKSGLNYNTKAEAESAGQSDLKYYKKADTVVVFSTSNPLNGYTPYTADNGGNDDPGVGGGPATIPTSKYDIGDKLKTLEKAGFITRYDKKNNEMIKGGRWGPAVGFGIKLGEVDDKFYYNNQWYYHVKGTNMGWSPGWIKGLQAESYDTGGYTGNWGPEGKVAMLHQKELVLNADDTSNMLQSVGLIRDVVRMIDHNASISSIGGLLSTPYFNSGGSNIEQDIKIYAEFPSATNHTEIEEAFNNLLNTASQYANRK